MSTELPGMDGKDITVEMSNEVFAIRDERKEEREGKNWHAPNKLMGFLVVPSRCPRASKQAKSKPNSLRAY